MKPETTEWVAKAEGDWCTAGRELRASEGPNYDAACFHAQQCAKYLKARLVEAGCAFPRVHDLEALLNIVLCVEPGWEHLRDSLQSLTDMAVEVRYPGASADLENAIEAVDIAEKVRIIVRGAFGLPGPV